MHSTAVNSTPFSGPPKVNYAAEDLLWAPSGMTHAEALQKLPYVCHRILTVPPSAWTLRKLGKFQEMNLESGQHAAAALIGHCIATGQQLLEAGESEPIGCAPSNAKRTRFGDF